MKKIKNLNEFKPSPQYILPSDNSELASFVKEYKIDMMSHVIKSIEYAIENNTPLAEVFQFKNSEFVITINKKDYLTNLNNIYEYFLQNEVYEYCDKIVRLRDIINNQ